MGGGTFPWCFPGHDAAAFVRTVYKEQFRRYCDRSTTVGICGYLLSINELLTFITILPYLWATVKRVFE